MTLSVVMSWLATLAAVATASVGVTVWFAQKRNSLRRLFLVLSIFIGLWIIGNVAYSLTESWKFPLALASYLFAMGVAVHLFLFALRLVSNNKLKFWTQVVVLTPGYLMGVLSVIPGVVAVGIEDGKIITSTISLGLYGIILGAYLVTSSVILIAARRRISPAMRQQVEIVLLGMAISSVAGSFFNLILPLLGEYRFVQLGPASALLFVGVVAYVIVRHRLFDIRVAIIRTAAYFLILASLTGLYFGLAYVTTSVLRISVLSTGQMITNIIIALLMALSFQPIKKFFDKVTNKLFYKDGYDSDDFFARLNRKLISTTDLRKLLQVISNEIGETLKSEQTSFFIYSDSGHYVSAGTRGHKQLPKADALMVNDYIHEAGEAIIVLGLTDIPQSVRRMIISHRLSVILPLVKNESIIGYLCLGDHRSSRYTGKDIKVLETVADALVIAVQNALSIQEIRDLNDSLQQRIAEATKELRASNNQLKRLDEAKDEFISMASHQLRTPLTSVKGYISMVLEGDVGKVTGEQRKMLHEAFNSSERMVHLINDFLNVSRLQTGKFTIEARPVNLAKLVEQELDSLQTSVASRGMKFAYKMPKNFPEVNVDESKISQVIMNFADNAMYYSRENSTINVKLAVEGEEIVFRVKDTGIGVPKEDQARLFTKFYRASNARTQRPDGTGVGLFLAKKVVDAHGGQIIFESVENKGSTFGFRLKLPKT